jgi:competence protein ComEA
VKLAAHERHALGVVAILVAVGGLVQYRTASRVAGWDGGEAEGDVVAARLVEEVELEVERSRRRARPLAPGERIDVNTAVADELQRLPRVGPALAARIVEHREANGPFRSLGELRSVPGVGPTLLDGIAEHVTLPPGPASANVALTAPGSGSAPAPAGLAFPLDINTAGAQELQRLPGVGPVLALRIVEWREANGPFRSVLELERVPGIGARTRERLGPLIRVGP